MQIADQNYFLDAEGNLTTDENDADIRLINKGQEIPHEMAEKYGLGKVAQEDDAPAAEDEEAPAPAKASASKKKGAK